MSFNRISIPGVVGAEDGLMIKCTDAFATASVLDGEQWCVVCVIEHHNTHVDGTGTCQR